MTHFDCGTRILRVNHGPEARATFEIESLPMPPLDPDGIPNFMWITTLSLKNDINSARFVAPNFGRER